MLFFPNCLVGLGFVAILSKENESQSVLFIKVTIF